MPYDIATLNAFLVLSTTTLWQATEAVAVCFGVIVSIVSAIQSRRTSRNADERYLQMRSESSNRSRQGYNAEFRRWADATLLSLSSAWHLCDMAEDQVLSSERVRLASTISALVDSGRLFFPNDEAGKRPRILDWPVFAHKLCMLIDHSSDRSTIREHLRSMCSGFAKDSQSVLNPLKLNSTMEELEKLLTSGGFMDTSMTDPKLQEVRTFLDSRT